MEVALQQLKPTQNKIIDLNSNRIITVLDNLITRIERLAYMNQRCEAVTTSSLLSEEVKLSFQNHYGLIEQAAKAPSPTVNAQLEQSTREVGRLIETNANLRSILEAATVQRSVGTEALTDQLSRLRGVLSRRLLTTVEEQRSQKALLQKLAQRDTSHQKEIQSLSSQLETATQERQQEHDTRMGIVKELEEHLESMTSKAAAANRQVLREAKMRENGHLTKLKLDTTALNAQLDELNKQLRKLQADNKEAELKLRKRKQKIEAQVEGWILKFDQDMGEKQKEMDAVQAQYDIELAQLKELQERFDVLEVTYNAIMAQRKKEREERQKAEEEMQRMIRAALLVQAMWRAYKSRKALKKKANKKGKKGKKK